ncbi:hypothetical protein JXB22_02960 [candidate division WOR-3 bacterium]|nr:hypothetical protein [candidate division WOR-3 bacterium]
MTDTHDMRPQPRGILIIDAVINFILGILLMIFPNHLVSFLGLPIAYEPFYASVLGAILIGIGLALVIECVRTPAVLGGLGMGGAIAINVCGACVIMLWLVSGRLIIPLRGYLVLWILVFVLLIVSAIELVLCESGITRRDQAPNTDAGKSEGEYEDN